MIAVDIVVASHLTGLAKQPGAVRPCCVARYTMTGISKPLPFQLTNNGFSMALKGLNHLRFTLWSASDSDFRVILPPATHNTERQTIWCKGSGIRMPTSCSRSAISLSWHRYPITQPTQGIASFACGNIGMVSISNTKIGAGVYNTSLLVSAFAFRLSGIASS